MTLKNAETDMLAPTLQKMMDARVQRLASLGVLFLLTIALLGFTGGYFFFNFLGKGQAFQFWSAGIIPVCNIAIGLLVSASLFGIYVALSLFHSDQERKS